MSEATILVLTVGGSLGPIKESIQRHAPDFIYFIPSVASAENVDHILKELYPAGFEAYKSCPIENPDDLVSCYRQCYEAFERANDKAHGEEIVVDLTGGTKVMSAALILACADLGLKVSYVSGEREKSGLGVVKNGTEQIVYSGHPFDLIAKKHKERFCESFNNYRFSAAIDACNDIAAGGGDRLRRIFTGLKNVSGGYRYWDLFRFKPALHQIKSGLHNIERLSKEYPAEIYRLEKCITAVRENLGYLEPLLAQGHSLEKVDDLTANACRRAEEGKYDDAVARLYRALEMVAQHRFVGLFGCNTSRFPLNKLKMEVSSSVFPRCSPDETKDIGCKEAFEILAQYGDEYGQRYKETENDIKSMLHNRNYSILAHGSIPLDRKHFDQAYEIFTTTFGIKGKVCFARIDAESLVPLGLE